MSTRVEMSVLARNEAGEPVHFQAEVGPFTFEAVRRLPGWHWAVYLGEPHKNVVWIQGNPQEPWAHPGQAVMAGAIALGNKLHILEEDARSMTLLSSPSSKGTR